MKAKFLKKNIGEISIDIENDVRLNCEILKKYSAHLFPCSSTYKQKILHVLNIENYQKLEDIAYIINILEGYRDENLLKITSSLKSAIFKMMRNNAIIRNKNEKKEWVYFVGDFFNFIDQKLIETYSLNKEIHIKNQTPLPDLYVRRHLIKWLENNYLARQKISVIKIDFYSFGIQRNNSEKENYTIFEI